MPKRSRLNLKFILNILLIYPVSVVTFKLFIKALNAQITIVLIIMTLVSISVSKGSKLYGPILSILIYSYIRVIVIIDYINIDIYTAPNLNLIQKSLYLFKSDKSLEINPMNLWNIYSESIIYIALIFFVSFIYILINSEWIKKKRGFLHVFIMIYFTIAWFNYIDVKTAMLLYILGILFEYSKEEKFASVVSIITIAVLLLNITNSLIPYELINEKVGKIAPKILIVRSDYKDRESFFNFENSIYYPQDSKLGGSVEMDSNKVIMEVVTREYILYLRGRVKDNYTGLNWQDEDHIYEKFESSKRYNEKKYHSDNLKSAFITYNNLNSLTVFSPLGSLEYSLDESKLRVDEDSSIYYKTGLFEDNIESYRIVFTGKDSSIASFDRYLKLPSTISERTIDLAKSIIKEGHSDIEKINAIKDYLMENYPYSLEISGDGLYGDFVDDFLFEEKKGYCTYYASSLAILARINQIPSRYVEGYVVEASSYDGEKYKVREDKAHAWTEVYIEDEGWMIVDSTPIYNYDIEEIEEHKALIEKEQIRPIEDDVYNDGNIDLEEYDEQIVSRENNIFVLYLIGILLLISYYIHIFRKRRYKSLSNREKSIKLIYDIEKILDNDKKIGSDNRYSVYQKMELFEDKYKEEVRNQRGPIEQKNAIIKDVKEILYSQYEVSSFDLINLEKYLKLVKKVLPR